MRPGLVWEKKLCCWIVLQKSLVHKVKLDKGRNYVIRFIMSGAQDWINDTFSIQSVLISEGMKNCVKDVTNTENYLVCDLIDEQKTKLHHFLILYFSSKTNFE